MLELIVGKRCVCLCVFIRVFNFNWLMADLISGFHVVQCESSLDSNTYSAREIYIAG